jgi:predicted  nucleic acid-binding Zn-ribbon protein
MQITNDPQIKSIEAEKLWWIERANSLADEAKNLETEKTVAGYEITNLREQVKRLQDERSQLRVDCEALEINYNQLHSQHYG